MLFRSPCHPHHVLLNDCPFFWLGEAKPSLAKPNTVWRSQTLPKRQRGKTITIGIWDRPKRAGRAINYIVYPKIYFRRIYYPDLIFIVRLQERTFWLGEAKPQFGEAKHSLAKPNTPEATARVITRYRDFCDRLSRACRALEVYIVYHK